MTVLLWRVNLVSCTRKGGVYNYNSMRLSWSIILPSVRNGARPPAYMDVCPSYTLRVSHFMAASAVSVYNHDTRALDALMP